MSADMFEVDQLQLYFGDDYVINDQIKIKQPTIGEVVSFGESKYFSLVHTLTAIPSDVKAMLDDINLDWEEVDDFQLFMMLTSTLPKERTSILFGDLDFTKFKPYRSKENGEPVLADIESGIKIDKLIYLRIVNYLRKLHNITPKVEHAANKTTKRILIEEDRMKTRANQNKPFKSYLFPLISSVKVRMGYTKDYVRNMGYMELMDDLARLQIINNADHILAGCYSGMIDTKKINKADLNWLKEI